ncbi:hypothetical protein M408DRAFT_21977 [Serendipita vermifera MAFF 305830]|uniref:PhoD-like phosphatase domain-containing protein n=1 Tax=Serendipita vermifera MAFF 305830 TaxID=933852 RepID=A0A0C3B132_SERVB|nr:hypothetical protein M408DRAFT_21977 [Serendipita vermifera MAFF 305830]
MSSDPAGLKPEEPKPPAELAKDPSQQKAVEKKAGSNLGAWKKPHNVHAYYGPPPHTYQTLSNTNLPSSKENVNETHAAVQPVTPLENGYSVPDYRPPGWLDHSTIPGPTRTLDSDQGATTHPGPPLSAVKAGKVKAVCDPHLQILCGPLLRYDTVKDNTWYGAVMIVTNDEESVYHPLPTLTVEWEAEDVHPFTPTREPSGGGGIGNPAGEEAVVGAQHGRLATSNSETTTPTHVASPSTSSTQPASQSSKSSSGEGSSSSSSSSSSDSHDKEEDVSKTSPKSKRSKSPVGTWASSMMAKLKALAPHSSGTEFRGRPPERIARTEQHKKEKQRSATMSVIEGEAIYKYSGIAMTATFWRFLIEVPVNPDPARGMKVHYAINKPEHHFNFDFGHSKRGPTDITFHIAPTGSDMRFAAYSCNGFSEGIDPNTFKGEGFDSGFDPVWADLLQRHEERPFHALVGGGDQIYCDTLTKEPELLEYMGLKNRQEKLAYPLTDGIMFTMDRYYFNHYCLVFRNGCFARAISEIPMVNMLDDHDLIDGFGSYPEDLQRSAFFKYIGSRGYFWFLLFQQFTVDSIDGTLVEPGQHTFKSTIIGADGPYIPFPSHSSLHWFGEKTYMLMLDCRAERRKDLIVSPETYHQIFGILRELPDTVEHLIVQLGIPIAYPRMGLAERIMHADGLLAKITRSGYLSSMSNKYNKDMELLDDLSDHWTAREHKKERNWLIVQLQRLALERKLRISFISGDVHLAAVGLFKTYAGKSKQFQHGRGEVKPAMDHRWMLNIISSAIVNTPPPPPMQATLNMLATHKHRTLHHSHTDEVMIPVFQEGLRTEKRRLNFVAGARNYTIGERDPATGEFVFDIRVEKRTGEGETKGYTVRAPRPEWAHNQEAGKVDRVVPK